MSLDATKTNQTIKGPDSRTYAELPGRFIRSATIAWLEISELKSMWPQCAAVIPDRVASAAIILGPWHMMRQRLWQTSSLSQSNLLDSGPPLNL